MTLSKAFAMKLSKLLSENKMSRYALEKKSGISRTALRYIFNEKSSDVNLSTVVKACDVFGLSVSEFFNDQLFAHENLEY